MAFLSFEAPTATVGLPADCALRMRVRRSAIGSDMLIAFSPTRFRQTGDLATVSGFTQLGACQSKLAVHAARPSGDRATVALTAAAGVAWLLLQLALSGLALFRSGLRVSDQLFER